jgi:ParB-like chromosome segregation protein Spo0J
MADTFNLRDHLAVHPAADLFPLMSESELKELAEDIRKNGLQQPIVTRYCRKTRQQHLIDGVNRLDALALLGWAGPPKDGGLRLTIRKKRDTIDPNPALELTHFEIKYDLSDEAVYRYVIAANVHRRHLTSEQKRDLIAKLVKAKPEVSNREIAKQVKADDKTVATVRRGLEATAEIPQLKKTIGKDGRSRPAEKKREAVSAPKVPALPTDTGLTVDQQRAADLKQVFSDAVHILLGLASRLPSAQLADIVPPSGLVMVANFLYQVAGNDAAASAEAMKAKHAEKPAPTSDDDLEIPGFLRRTAQATQ